jgi:hypothetical protein
MAYEQTWSFLTNQPYTPTTALDAARYSMWWKASALTGGTAWPAAPATGKWTLYASSDGVTAGIDATDRWNLNGVYDGTKIVRAVSGPHSWIILRSPLKGGVYYYITFDYLSSNDYTANFYNSLNAPTGGTTSLRPTHANEWSPSGLVTPAHFTSTLLFKNSIGMTTEGDFWISYVRLTIGYPEQVFVVALPAGYQVSDQCPIVNFWISNTPATLAAFYGAAYNQSKKWNSLTTPVSTQLMYGGGSSVSYPDAINAQYLVLPAHYIGYETTTSWAYRGRLRDFGVSISNAVPVPTASVVMSGGAVAYCFLGNLLVPT